VHKVSIIPRGGRAAESLVFDEVSTGAADDLAKVTDIARAMVVRYGMNEELGNVAYEEERRSFLGNGAPMLQTVRKYSEETAREIDRAVRDLVGRAFRRAREILDANRDLLDESANLLLARETLAEEELRAFAARIRAASLPALATAPTPPAQ
jgi:cell division protease FtsH